MTPQDAEKLTYIAQRAFLQFHEATTSSRKLMSDLEEARLLLLELHRLTAVLTGQDLEPPSRSPMS